MEQGRTELAHDIDICCEQKFQSYDEFLELLEKRRLQLGERWVKTSGGRTGEAANRVLKNKEKFYKAELKYQYVNFICIHGGIHRSQATERNTSTRKLNCPVHLQLSANRKENALVVKKVMLVHNHELVALSTQPYALDRRATDKEVMEITKLKKLGISASKIIAHMAQSSGKVFKPDDIHNISRVSKNTRSSVENEVWTILKEMMVADSDSQYSVHADNGEVDFLLFQTGCMRRIFNEYHDVVYIDGTYCVNNIGYPLYVFLCADGNQKGQVVAYAVVKNETKETLTNLFKEFKVKASKKEVKTIIIDKDAAEIAAVKQAFPSASIVMCRFHVAQNFRTALGKYCCPRDVPNAKQSLWKMLYTSSEEVFFRNYNQLPPRLKVYVNKNWLPIRDCWAQFLTKHVVTWGSKTNNYVERHNRLVKSLSGSNKSLPDLLRSLLEHHRVTELCLAQSAFEMSLKTDIFLSSSKVKPLIEEAVKFLTPAASKRLLQQLELAYSDNCVFEVEGDVVSEIRSGNLRQIHITNGNCLCTFSLDHGLPCWHIMVHRIKHGRPPVSEVDIPKRWLRSTLIDTYSRQAKLELGTATIQVQKTTQSVKELTEFQKRTRGSILMDELLTVMVTSGMNSYLTRCRVLEKIIHEWRQGHDIPYFSELTHLPEQRDTVCQDDNVGNFVFADDAVSINGRIDDVVVLHGKDEDVVVSPVYQYQNVDNYGMISGAKSEDAGLRCVVDKDVMVHSLSHLQEIGNTQSNKQSEGNKNFPDTGIVTVSTNVSSEDKVQFIASDHAYCVVPSPFGELRFRKAIKKRGRPKGAGQTSGHYCSKKAKTQRGLTVTGVAPEFIVDPNICYVCNNKLLQVEAGTSAQMTEWISCMSCERWFHRYCLFAEAKRIPSSFACIHCTDRS